MNETTLTPAASEDRAPREVGDTLTGSMSGLLRAPLLVLNVGLILMLTSVGLTIHKHSRASAHDTG